ncbi:MAG: hypothetical protein KDB07_13270, partial [Planctomycetes bacterium]|nr:hypothetical protein [Planctomycetota bacterium]
GRVALLLNALSAAGKEAAADPEVAAVNWQSYDEVKMTFESGKELSFQAQGKNVYMLGARAPVTLDLLELSVDPRRWMILSYDMLADLHPADAMQLSPDDLDVIACNHPQGAWELVQSKSSKRWASRDNGLVETRRTTVANLLWQMQNIALLGLWEGEAPTLIPLVAKGGNGLESKISLSLPEGNARFAAMRIGDDEAIYQISPTAAKMLLPMKASLEDIPLLPVEEGSDEVYFGGTGKGFQVLVFAHKAAEYPFNTSAASREREPAEAVQMGKDVLSVLMNSSNAGIDFAKVINDGLSDFVGESRLERLPLPAMELPNLVEAMKTLKPGQVHDKVFSTPFGEMILIRDPD